MIPNEHFKFLIDNRISDGLLREFVLKGLWKQSIVAINAGIDKRLKEVEDLQNLRGKLEEELTCRTDDVHSVVNGI